MIVDFNQRERENNSKNHFPQVEVNIVRAPTQEPAPADMMERKQNPEFGLNMCVLGLDRKGKLCNILWSPDIARCDIQRP